MRTRYMEKQAVLLKQVSGVINRSSGSLCSMLTGGHVLPHLDTGTRGKVTRKAGASRSFQSGEMFVMVGN